MTRRVLVLSPRFPLPLQSGEQIRTYHVLAALADSFDVTLASLAQDNDPKQVSQLEAMGIEVELVPHSRTRPAALARFALSRSPYRVCRFATPPFRELVADLLAEHEFDLLWVNFVQTLAVTPADLNLPVVVDEHNSDVRYWQSFLDGGLPVSLFAHLNISRIERFRDRVADRIDVVLSVSAADAEDARSWATDAAVHVAPNGVDIMTFAPTKSADEAPSRVVFVGSLDVTMNTEAVTWFCETAWPAIRDAHPDAMFDIVGRSPDPEIEALADEPGVELHPDVPEVVPYYERAAVAVMPFAFGGGSKLKILEALSMARPVVTTPTGIVGIDLEDGVHADVRDRGEGFAGAVANLLSNPERRQALGTAGREFVTERFTWEQITTESIEFVTDHLFRESRP